MSKEEKFFKYTKAEPKSLAEVKEEINEQVKQHKIKESADIEVVNGKLKECKLEVVGHFDAITLDLYLNSKDGDVRAVGGRDLTPNLGFVIKFLVKLLGLSEDDGYDFSSLKNVPVRLVTFEVNKGHNYGKHLFAMGNFMEDKFVLLDELELVGFPKETTK